VARAARWVRDQRNGGRLGPVVDRRVPLSLGAAAQALVGVRCAAVLDPGDDRPERASDLGRARACLVVPGGRFVLDGTIHRYEPAPGRTDWPYATVLGRLEGPAARRGPRGRSVLVELSVEPWADHVSNLVLRLRTPLARLGFTPAVADLLVALDEALVAMSVDLALGRLSLLDDAAR
jgi:hypothetical protein